MRLNEFKNVLLSTGLKVFHGEALKYEGNFISWFEVKKKYKFADDRRELATYQVDVFYVTKAEYDEENVEHIEDKFDDNDICYSSAEIDYIAEKKAWVYRWLIEFSYGI